MISSVLVQFVFPEHSWFPSLESVSPSALLSELGGIVSALEQGARLDAVGRHRWRAEAAAAPPCRGAALTSKFEEQVQDQEG